jgi:hypothetical protein
MKGEPMSHRAFVLATVATFAMIAMAQFAHHPTAPPAGTEMVKVGVKDE